MQEIVKSVGIDIGTTTTQLVFSELVVEDLSGGYTVPRVSIVEKRVTYRSGIHFTPLLSPTQIDAAALQALVREEYQKAGMRPADLQTGAVIITGDTARKSNANEVLEALSGMAGDFVVATAGPDLESVLAGRGAGADRLSEEFGAPVANVDIGGGTSNLALFENGVLRGTSCLDIGGRLVRVENGRVASVFPKIAALAREAGVPLAVGDPAGEAALSRLCDCMAGHLMQALRLLPESPSHRALYTNGGSPLPERPAVGGVTFSGGVADSVYNETAGGPFRYGDIGVLLGQAVRRQASKLRLQVLRPAETIRATVVGAGTHTVEVSGSTIAYARGALPLRNLPVLRVPEADEPDLAALEESIRSQAALYSPGGDAPAAAISLSGKGRSSFAQVQQLAEALVRGAAPFLPGPAPLVVVVENDIGKALGNAVKVRVPKDKPVVCIDSVHARSGDYIDIGAPLANGHVVPVVIKTLIFNT